MSHKYHLTSRVTHHLPPLEKDAAVDIVQSVQENEGAVAGNAAVIASILFPEDGSYSIQIESFDGRGEGCPPLSGHERFKAWMMWAGQLAQDSSVPEVHRALAKMTFDGLCEAIFGRTPPEPSEVM